MDDRFAAGNSIVGGIFDGVKLAIDTTECPIHSFYDPFLFGLLNSGKYKTSTLKYQLVVRIKDGKICHVCC